MHRPIESLPPLCGEMEIDILVRLAGGGGSCSRDLPITAVGREMRMAAILRLARWECLTAPETTGPEPLHLCDMRFTQRGLDLLEMLDPVAAAFARVKHAEYRLYDFRALRASLEPAA